MTKSHDVSIIEACNQAEELVKQGFTVYQKWTCEHCKVRQSMPVPNTFYTQGSCEECHGISSIKKCGYLLVGGGTPVSEIERLEAMRKSAEEVKERGVKQ